MPRQRQRLPQRDSIGELFPQVIAASMHIDATPDTPMAVPATFKATLALAWTCYTVGAGDKIPH